MIDTGKEALEYVVGLSEPHKINGEDGFTYVDKSMRKLEKEKDLAEAMEMRTLSSLVDYIKSNTDKLADKMVVHVISPTQVKLFSQLNEDRNREPIADVSAKIPGFKFNSYIDREEFGIALQSKFIPDEERNLLLAFIGNVEDGTVAAYGDDGVTQKATVKTGLASKADAKIPNPVRLTPYRTFLEVDQPESQFIFRMKSDRGVQCAIFEADGGAWELEAMENVKEYLSEELKDLSEQFTVIS